MRSLAAHPAARNLDDDAAVLEFGGEALVLTHDAMAEGVHFLPGQDPADVAWRLVATNISDLAAKGAQPLGVLLAYQLGKDDADDVRFLAGLKDALDHYGAPLLGGDTLSGGGNGHQTLGLTAIGRAVHRPVPARSGARVGDDLWITGPIGAAMLGFEALQTGSGDSSAYRRPQARLAEGIALAPRVTAMMDVSDGLLLDATRMARASGVCLAIDPAAVPIACAEARRGEALRWGDDYQLLFTLPPGAEPPVTAFLIGTALPAQAAPVLLGGVPPSPADGLGYEHR